MCGIAGYLGNGRVDPEEILRTLGHRGPDDRDFVCFEGAVLMHTRLSIIDLSSAGRQPMSNEDGSLWLICNGEIYNSLQLRQEMAAKGHKFRSNSDSEVIIHLYEEYGSRMLPRLRGMFAFGLFSRKTGELFLARDPFGIKPLVYSLRDGRFAFSSEIAAIKSMGGFCREIDRDAINLYKTVNYIPAPYSVWKDVRKLPPGHFLKVDKSLNKLEITKYFVPDFKPWNGSANRAEEKLEELLKESVKAHLISDVPVGAFLSGGLDSSLIVALASKIKKEPVRTLTVTFPDSPFYDESRYASLVAKHLNTEHCQIPVTQKEALESVIDIVDSLDEPFGDSSLLPCAIISKFARQSVKTVLSGDGGDELFAGYSKYQGLKLAGLIAPGYPLLRLFSALPLKEMRDSFWGDKTRQFRKLALLSGSNFYDRLARSISMNMSELPLLKTELGNIIEEGVSLGMKGLNLALYLDSRFVLPYDMLAKVDIASMRYGLEVRVPLVDEQVYNFAFSLPADWKLKGFTRKWLLSKVAGRHLPAEIIKRRKQGFGIPLGKWLRCELKTTLMEELRDPEFAAFVEIETKSIEDMLNQHLSLRKDRFWEIWNLFVLARWRRRNLG